MFAASALITPKTNDDELDLTPEWEAILTPQERGVYLFLSDIAMAGKSIQMRHVASATLMSRTAVMRALYGLQSYGLLEGLPDLD